MPTAITHGLTGLGLAAAFAVRPMHPAFYALSTGLALLPDIDVLSFSLGIPYRSRFGHRGFTHSLFFALLAALPAALLTASPFGVDGRLLAGFYFVVIVTHDALDALTNGGLGVAFLAPFDETRYFFPWRPVQVSPIGMAAFSRWGLRALLSEVVWVWLPLAGLVAASLLYRTLA